MKVIYLWVVIFVLIIYSIIITKKYFAILKHKKKSLKTLKNSIKEEKTVRGDLKEFLNAIHQESLIGLIIGRRGSGKTALALSIAELLKGKKKVYVMGVSHLPRWIKVIRDINDAKNGSLLIIDEGALFLSSRSSMKQLNKRFSELMAISRHKDLSLIIITQNSAMLDVNTLRMADYLLIKKPSLLQSEMERHQIRKIIEKADNMIPKENFKKYCYIISDYYEGLVSMGLPSFWTNNVSKSFR